MKSADYRKSKKKHAVFMRPAYDDPGGGKSYDELTTGDKKQ